MAGFTNTVENQLLNAVFRGVPYTPPAAVYMGLFTAAPGETGGGTEVSAGGYARQLVTFNAASNGAIDSEGNLTFGPASADWGTITHVAYFDAVSGGNMLAYAALTPNKTITNLDTFRILDGNATFTLD